MLNTPLGRFRTVALLEGASFLVLLLIAMPLKYAAGMPLAVKVVGWAHGVLFVAYMAALLEVWIAEGWRFGKVVLAFVASLVPGGTFWLDARLKREAQGAAQ